jgi:hypothetical protein
MLGPAWERARRPKNPFWTISAPAADAAAPAAAAAGRVRHVIVLRVLGVQLNEREFNKWWMTWQTLIPCVLYLLLRVYRFR